MHFDFKEPDNGMKVIFISACIQRGGDLEEQQEHLHPWMVKS